MRCWGPTVGPTARRAMVRWSGQLLASQGWCNRSRTDPIVHDPESYAIEEIRTPFRFGGRHASGIVAASWATGSCAQACPASIECRPSIERARSVAQGHRRRGHPRPTRARLKAFRPANAVAVDRCSRVASPRSPCSRPIVRSGVLADSRGEGARHLDGVTGAHQIGRGRWRRRGVDPPETVSAIATGSPRAPRNVAGPSRAARKPRVSWDQRERGVCDDR
jgi:hypothetical protein